MSHDPKFRRTDGRLHRHQGRKKRSFRMMIAIGLFLVLAALGLTYVTYNFVTAPDQFVVRQLVINGAVFADIELIRSKVTETTEGNMLLVDLNDVCRAVEEIPWIEEASARKVLPDTLQLEVVESRPSAYTTLSGELMLVDSYGNLIDRLKPEHPFIGLPVIQGVDNLDHEAQGRRLQLCVSVLSELQILRPDWYSRLSELDVSDPAALTIYLQGGLGPIIVGDKMTISHLTKYFMIEASLQERYDAVEYIDTRFNRRLFVKEAGE